MNVTLKKGDTEATISSLGAELISVRHSGRERLWQNENGGWASHAPVLFPVSGHCSVIIDGVDFNMSAHGFAKREEFALKQFRADYAAFSLRANERTRARFPYEFELRAEYLVYEGGVYTLYTVCNLQKTPMYFSIGAHPSFALSKDVDSYRLSFEQEEVLLHHVHDEGGYLSGETVDFGRRASFELPAEYLQHGNTLIFSDIKSRSVTLEEIQTGQKVARVDFDGFSNLLLWRPHGAKMLCIEPWAALPDARDDVREFASKRGIFCLKGEESKTFSLKITYFN